MIKTDITIKATHEGKVDELIVKKGGICNPGAPLLRVIACLHDIQING